ncbi:MAG: maltose ABC transporter substrate-binding protein [Anaerolineae bacterium]|nr:maltose ABC transporter substrate-binding protein [Anaerolineae bacterium]
MKKSLSLLVIVVLLSVIGASSLVSAQDVSLTLWVYDDGRLEVLNQLGEQFEAEYGVSLSVEVVDLSEIRNTMTLGAASGEGPDMIIIPHDNLGPLVENGAAAVIDLGDKAESYLPNAIDGFTYNGALYGLPLAVENIGFFRNSELVPDAPATWAEVAEIGQALFDEGKIDSAIGLPDLTYNIYPVFTSFGGYIFGRDDAGNFTVEDFGLNNEGMAAGLAWVKSLVDMGIVSDNIDWESSHVLFETGRSAFIMTGPWAINRFDTAGVPYAISAFPAAEEGGEPGYPFLGVQGLVVNAYKENALLAQVFAVDFLATEENYQAIFDAEPRPSAWASIFNAAEDPNTAGFNAAGVNAVPMPSIPAMGYVWDAWVNAGTLVVQGELSPEEALDGAVAQVLAQLEAD